MNPQKEQHFLVAVYPGQGHINPVRSLARRLAKATGARVTFSTAVSAHRHMFPALSNPAQEITNGPITYAPYTDGYDDGIEWFAEGIDVTDITEKLCTLAPASLGRILDDLAIRGVPVTCMIYGLNMHWAKDVAVSRDISSVMYWPQPATVLGIYYHYFYGYQDLITSRKDEPYFVVNLPHLAPLRIRDLPCFLFDSSNELYNAVLEWMRLSVESVLERDKEGRKSTLLINTFEELESEALKSVQKDVQIFAIGPDIASLLEQEPEPTGGGNLFKTDGQDYIAWLNTKPNKSVVYVSFGSISSMSKKQLHEMQSGLRASKRPYLWVVRKNNRDQENINLEYCDDNNNNGMVVEWCDQVKVLSHPSVGCFVTHCGWNSTLESLASGVPVVTVPQWTDQDTNAKLVAEWGVGVRGEVNEKKVLEGEVLVSCLECVMGDGEKGVEIRESSRIWAERTRNAVKEGGSSDTNFKNFLRKITEI